MRVFGLIYFAGFGFLWVVSLRFYVGCCCAAFVGVCWCCLLGSFVVDYCLLFKSTPFVFVNSVDTRFLCGLLGAGGCL